MNKWKGGRMGTKQSRAKISASTRLTLLPIANEIRGVPRGFTAHAHHVYRVICREGKSEGFPVRVAHH